MFKKLLISISLSLFLLTTLFTPYAHAQDVTIEGTWYHPSLGEFLERVYDPNNEDDIFGERYTQAQVVWIWYSLMATLLPPELLGCMVQTGTPNAEDAANCIGPWLSTIGISVGPTDPAAPSLAYIFNGITLNSPASGVGYFVSLATKFHVIPEAGAQGFGFSTLSPVQQIWGAIRNIAYFILVIAFVAIAFMVMFRVKISPQTVISVQSAIPRIVLILLLITFSYAIAGFVIDLSYVAVGLLAVVGTTVSSLSATNLFSQFISGQPILSLFVVYLVYILGIILAPNALNILFGSVIAGIAVIIGVILFAVLLIAFIIIWIRLIWIMLRTFINIVLLVVFSPIILLGGVFPSSGGFGSWLRDLTAQVAVFPGIIGMIFLAHFIFWSSLDPASTNFIDQVFVTINNLFPGLLNPYQINPTGSAGSIQLPGFNIGTGGLFGFITSFMIIFLVPSVTNIIQSVISRRPFAYGTAIGAAIGGAAGIAAFPATSAWGATSQARNKAFTEMLQTRSIEPIREMFRRRTSGG